MVNNDSTFKQEAMADLYGSESTILTYRDNDRPKTEFTREEWNKLVNRIRVHEMLKCIQDEHEKLQVIRNHTDLGCLLDQKKNFLEENSQESTDTTEDDEQNNQQNENIDKQLNSENNPVQNHLALRIQTEKEIISRNCDTLFIKTKQEEMEAMAKMYSTIKATKSNPRFVSRMAVKLFRTKSKFSDAEFQSILELCEDPGERKLLFESYQEKQNKEKYLHNAGEKKKLLYDVVNSKFFIRMILITIFISIVNIYLLTFERIAIRYSYFLLNLDSIIIGIFIVEAGFKIIIYHDDYFKQMWNLLDLSIIIVHLLELTVDLLTYTLALSTNLENTIYFKFLNSLRALRLLRVIKFLPHLKIILNTVFQSILSLGSIAFVMTLFIFVFAVLGKGLFHEHSPEYFGTIWLSLITMFELLTLDDWFELMFDAAKSPSQYYYWVMFIYLFCYFAIEYFIFLSLFVAVLVDNFQQTLKKDLEKKKNSSSLYPEGADTLLDMINLNQKNEKDRIRSENAGKFNIPKFHAEDFYSCPKGSRKADFLENFFKDLASIDFYRFMWKRRFRFMNVVLDRVCKPQFHQWRVQDKDYEPILRPGMDSGNQNI